MQIGRCGPKHDADEILQFIEREIVVDLLFQLPSDVFAATNGQQRDCMIIRVCEWKNQRK